MIKEYRFNSFQDAYEKVPANKLEECFSQIGTMLAAAKNIDEINIELSKTLGVAASYSKLPDELGWIDDGKCDIDITMGNLRFHANT